MAAYTFSLGNATNTRQAGIIHSESFDHAVKLVGERMSVAQGDTLEIGVPGFPPARFECVSTLFDGSVVWQPARLAA